MKRHFYALLSLVMLVIHSARGEEQFQGYPLTQEGAWCWFADPRAVHYTSEDDSINASYIGYIDVHGNVKAMQMDYVTGVKSEVLVRSYFQPDDHNNPTFLVLPDKRVLIIYSRHTDEPAFYYRVSKRPGDITQLGEEKCIKTNHNTTYPSPFLMSDDPEHFYLCWRGLGWHPTIARLTLPDENDDVQIKWGPYQMVQSTGARPYAKYYSNGKDKLYMTYTTGHPDNEQPNWVYFNVINLHATTDAEGRVSVAPTLEDIRGKQLSTIANGTFAVSKTDAYKSSYPYTIVDAPTGYRDWVWQIACDAEGLPIIAMVRINGGKDQHQYYYAKWTGDKWRLTSLADGGGRFHSSNTEYCYSGGEALDPENPHIIYLSIPTTGTSGKKIYEIWKYTLNDAGAITAKEQITRNSTKNNVRPFVLPGSSASPMRLVWMHGDYYYWLVRQGYPQGYPTAIHSDYKWTASETDLQEGIIEDNVYDSPAMSTDRTEQLALTDGAPFTLHLSLGISATRYYGTLLTLGNMTYSLDQSTVKPYVKIDGHTYTSSNQLYSSDNWALHSTGTGGDSWPTPLPTLNLTLTYDGTQLIVYRGGLIDQVIPCTDLQASSVAVGGYEGTLHQAITYGRALSQDEVQQLIRERILDALVVPGTTCRDLVLPTKVAGENVVWSSSHPDIVAPDGTLASPEALTTVTLTATTQGATRTFRVNVQPRDIADNLLLSYTFDPADTYTQGGTTYVRDQGTRALDLQLKGKATVDGTLNLTGNTATAFATNGYAIVPAAAMDSLRSYTVMLTVTPKSLGSQPRLYDFGHSSANSLFLRANALSAGIKYNGGATTMVNASASLKVGTTYRLAVTYDARSGFTSIYIDGQLVASGTDNKNEPYMIALGAECTRNYIGRTQWWDTSYANDNGDYVGTIDDFSIYTTALTEHEIATLLGLRIEDDALNVDYSAVLLNPDFEGSYSPLSGSGTTSDRAIYVPKGWTASYTTRNENDMTILNSSCLYASLFTAIPTTQGGGNNAYLVRQKWGTSTISMSQQCDTLPAGRYRLQADVWQSGTGGNAQLWVQVASTTPDKSTMQGDASAWRGGKIEFTCDGTQTVKIGFAAIHTANGSEQYIGFDNFSLLDITANCSEEELYALLTTLSATAEKLLSGSLSDAARTLLSDALAATDALPPHSPHAQLLDAYHHLRDAISRRDEQPSTITTTPEATPHATIYNLLGQPIDEATSATHKGVYIINHRKVTLRP